MLRFKQLFTTTLFMMSVVTIQAQEFILTVDGNTYWTRENIKDIKDVDEIIVDVGRKIIRVPKVDVVLIEYEKDGLVILQPNKIKKIEPVAFEGDLISFMEKGKRVFIPYSSTDICQRSGAKRLRELLMGSDYWNIVYCEDEADMILEYVFDDEGRDHAYLMLTDRKGNQVLSTSSVNARDIVPTHAGEKSADELYKKVFTKCILKGILWKRVRYVQPKKSNHFCLYYLD